MVAIGSATELVRVAFALGAGRVRGVAKRQDAAPNARRALAPNVIEDVRAAILDGDDPLGEALSALRTREERRERGAVYTPRALVAAMVDWSAPLTPGRIVDPGAGSGRFLITAGRRHPRAELVGVDTDELALLLLAANAAVHGVAERTRVIHGDYRRVALPAHAGQTLFVGNPPYVRHHSLTAPDKAWVVAEARHFGLKASRLAGLHAHFFLRTAGIARPGDAGVFVTSAEWLDVNYGSLVRRLFLEPLGGTALHLVEPSAKVFENAETTAVVACFECGSRPPRVRFRKVASLDELDALRGGALVSRARLTASERWSGVASARLARPVGHVELGELFRVHRGQVTGKNAVWIAAAVTPDLPASVQFRAVTRARELFSAGAVLADVAALRFVIDIPAELELFTPNERRAVERFLAEAKRLGADRGFIAGHRRPWWAVRLRAAAPILATYMARRAPVFVRNPRDARHVNIAHGLYPLEPMSPALLDAVARYLTEHVSRAAGRTYAGGLTKFEPREMERLLLPRPERLEE